MVRRGRPDKGGRKIQSTNQNVYYEDENEYWKYKNKRREGKKSVEQEEDLEGMGEANRRNKTRKFYTISGGVNADFQRGNLFLQTGKTVYL